MEELTCAQYIAIQGFAQGLKECFRAKRQQATKDDVVDRTVVILMDYAISIIDIHLELASIAFDRHNHNQLKQEAVNE